MKDWFKKITGIAAKEEALAAKEAEIAASKKTADKKMAAEKAAIEAEQDKLLMATDPKTYATKKGQPWVNVLDMKVNDDNIRNGFFELDWNDLFIEQLLSNGYGSEGDVPEEVVDRWFKDIVYNMLQDEGLDTTRNAGYINVVPLAKGKSEVS
jgi:hypothetical protein